MEQYPIAGIDYPRDFQEFDRWFQDEAACRRYVFRLRWPEGYQCRHCKRQIAPWITSRRYMHCRECGRESSIIAGTVFAGTRKPLRTWFQAMWLITSQKYGGSALGLQRTLGLGSYQTAWAWLHKLRRAMVNPSRKQLHGDVEVDETYIGGSKKGGKRGRGTENKDIVVIALEILSPKGFGRVRMKRISDVSGENLVPFVCDEVKPGSHILTDGWSGYNELKKNDFIHKKVILSKSGDPAHVLMPGVHRIASLLKRWLLGTHQGAVKGKHLDYYLDEYTFRFNRRKSSSRGMLFYRLMQQAVMIEAVPYHQLVDNDHNM